ITQGHDRPRHRRPAVRAHPQARALRPPAVTRLALLVAAACGACTIGPPARPDAAAADASVRFAHLAPDLAPELDICLLRAGDAVLGTPVARVAGVPYVELGKPTRRIAVPPRPVELRIIRAGSAGCGVGAQPGVAVTIPAGRSAIALAGVVAGGRAPPLTPRGLAPHPP